MKRGMIVANWKMNGDTSLVKKTITALKGINLSKKNAEVVICPPFPLISELHGHSTSFSIGAQDCSSEASGAFTGDVSPYLLNKMKCKYVIIGHSERRAGYNETNNIVRKKAEAALSAGLTPIICVGETYNQRESCCIDDVITSQVKESVPKKVLSDDIVIAYEPIWSIGTGKVPNNNQIDEVVKIIENTLFDMCINKDKHKVNILYGGSVNDGNVKQLNEINNISGYLIGSASLNIAVFSQIIKEFADC